MWNFSSYMMSNILKILHPFIPFFTESLWTTNRYDKFFNSPLIQADWLDDLKNYNYKKNYKDISSIIEIISNIRSTKAELNIKPKLFCDIVVPVKSKILKKLINQNIEIIKQTGRINSLLIPLDQNTNTVEILILKEKLALKFNEDIDITSQKNRIWTKIENLVNKIKVLGNKLNNKAYLMNAPKQIVQNDKELLSDLIIEENKLRSIVSSIN